MKKFIYSGVYQVLFVCLFLVFFISKPVDAARFRKKITIDHTNVLNIGQKNFPVFISLTDSDLKAKSIGKDIYFTLLSGNDNGEKESSKKASNTRLPHELISFDRTIGKLKAWVGVPSLSSSINTDVYMWYGDSNNVPAQNGEVWDSHYVLVKHLKNANNPHIEVPGSESINLTDEITVEAWVYSDNYRAETFQPIVSKWESLTSFNTFDGYDAGETDGLESRGYFGAVFDGRYVYYSAQRHGHEFDSTHGIVMRYDTQGDFNDPESYSAYDAGNTNGLKTKGYYGAVFDGRYVYFVPRGVRYFDFDEFHSKVLRYDTHRDFKSSESWEAYDIGEKQTQQSAAFDGRYIYFIPFVRKVETGEKKSIFHTNFLRYDTQGQFDASGSWDAYDASGIDNLNTVGYNGGAFDGRYFYLAPWQYDKNGEQIKHCSILRYDTVEENGSFILKYCNYGHNGGLCAAVPGPSFIVNTVKGPLSISAHEVLVPGWHHITGVYNGRTIKLFIDGVLAAERSGSGSIQNNTINVTIGGLHKGTARFSGIIDEVRISNIARNDDWIKTEYLNLINTSGFIHVGEEEVLK